MKKEKNEMVQEVGELLERTVIAEAADEVGQQFERAMAKLDHESVELLKDFFNGATVRELSLQRRLAEPEVEAWLTRAKRDLVQHLRTTCQVRQ